MARYYCNICNAYEYDDQIGDEKTGVKPGTKPKDFPDSWRCPICQSKKNHIVLIQEEKNINEKSNDIEKDINYYRDLSREKLIGLCSANKVCDGHRDRLCQGQKFGKKIGFGGAGQGKTFDANFKALAKYKIKMRIVKSHSKPKLNTSFLEKTLSMPVLVPSISGVTNMNDAISEEDFQKGMIEGAKLAGTIGMSGQPPTHANKHPGMGLAGAILIFKPQSQEMLKKEFASAKKAGAIAVGVDLDGCGSTNWEKMGKPVYRKNPDELKELVDSTTLPVIFKGIMSVEDAQAVADSGASAMAISNHGGRVMDSGLGTCDVLPEIAKRFKGKITIIIDGAIRTGYDVIKVLALGADLAMIGRPLARMAIAGGPDAVSKYLEYVKKEFTTAMIMTGCNSIEDISKDIILKDV